MIWIWLRWGNITRETESPSIAAQNSNIRFDFVLLSMEIQCQITSKQKLIIRDIIESVDYVETETILLITKLDQKEDKSRHD